MFHDALHLPEYQRCAFAGGKALLRQLAYHLTLRVPTLASGANGLKHGLFLAISYQRATSGYGEAVGHISTGFAALALEVVQGISGTLTDGFSLPRVAGKIM